MAEVKGYILKTHLVEDSNRVFYYQGTAYEPAVSLAMNSIVALDGKHAKVFSNINEVLCLCSMLNSDSTLIEHGYTKFEVEEI